MSTYMPIRTLTTGFAVTALVLAVMTTAGCTKKDAKQAAATSVRVAAASAAGLAVQEAVRAAESAAGSSSAPALPAAATGTILPSLAPTSTASTPVGGLSEAMRPCASMFPNGQVPTVNQLSRDLCFKSYATLYSPQTKKPIMSIERLGAQQGTNTGGQRTDDFHPESRLLVNERAELSDYQGSGFDRGHNAPAGDAPESDVQAMSDTFSLANMMPQNPEHNRGVWAKSVEMPTRKFANRASGNVFVYTGSVGNGGVIGANRVMVPTYVWKLVYDEAGQRVWAYWLPNDSTARVTGVISLAQLVANIKAVEGVTVDFNLPAGVQ